MRVGLILEGTCDIRIVSTLVTRIIKQVQGFEDCHVDINDERIRRGRGLGEFKQTFLHS